MSKDFYQSIELYSDEVIQKSKKDLGNSFNFELILSKKFDIVNASLIDRTLNQNDSNLFIQTILTESKKSYYFPVIIAVAASLFFKNYCDDKTDYKIGDVLQKDGIRYKINAICPEYYELVSFQKRGAKKTTRIYKADNLKKYKITTADLSKRKTTARFDDYESIFNNLFWEKVDYFPSKFSYKSVIILEKKSFLKELKYHYKFDFKKSIPFMWVTKNGIQKNESEYIPIEPMIYLTSDYEVFQEHIAEKIENLDAVIFIGKNKYYPHLTKIKRDLRRKVIPKVIFIGNEDIAEIENIRKWKWTYPEIQFLENKTQNEIKVIEISSENLMDIIDDFKNYIKSIENEYIINLGKIIYYSRYLFSLFPIYIEKGFIEQIEYYKRRLIDMSETEISNEFISINQDYIIHVNIALEKIEKIFCSMDVAKFTTLLIQKKIDVIITTPILKGSWLNLTKTYSHLANCQTEILTLNEFRKKQADYLEQKNIFITSIFYPYIDFKELIRFMNKCSHNFTFILYTPEKKLYDTEFKKIEDEFLSEYNSEDRFKLVNIEFPMKKRPVSIFDKIEELYSDYFDLERKYVHDCTENIIYLIEDTDSRIEEIEGSRTVIVENIESEPKKEKVANLVSGDKIRIYENTDRKKLFQIAKNEDDEDRFGEILSYSILWKKKLLEYYQKQSFQKVLYNEIDLLNELIKNGAKISAVTLKNWLDVTNDHLFPNEISNLKAIQRTVNNEEFDNLFGELLRCRRLYRSIMISLGHHLSEELNEYILSKKELKGEFLQKFSENQIESFLKHTAPLRTIKSIEILNRGLDE